MATDNEWQRFDAWMQLYRAYLTLVLQADIFFYGITGGLVAFVLNDARRPILRFALLLPLAMSLMLASMTYQGNQLVQSMDDELRDTKVPVGPSLAPLRWLLKMSGLLFVLTAIGLLVVIAFGPCLGLWTGHPQ